MAHIFQQTEIGEGSKWTEPRTGFNLINPERNSGNHIPQFLQPRIGVEFSSMLIQAKKDRLNVNVFHKYQGSEVEERLHTFLLLMSINIDDFRTTIT